MVERWHDRRPAWCLLASTHGAVLTVELDERARIAKVDGTLSAG